MRTIVYVDGYNLYYGRLSQTSFKWLDVVKLLSGIVMEQSPESSVDVTRYFTAPALARYARRGTTSVEAQGRYLRALQQIYQDQLTIINGNHVLTSEPLPRFIEGVQPSKDDRVEVWRIVEKKTDVNLALAMYRDACADRCDQIVLCSNDSDAEPALEALRSDFPAITLGVISPVQPGRPSSETLSNLAHWRRRSISDDQLASAQLPECVPTKKKAILKPDHWKALPPTL